MSVKIVMNLFEVIFQIFYSKSFVFENIEEWEFFSLQCILNITINFPFSYNDIVIYAYSRYLLDVCVMGKKQINLTKIIFKIATFELYPCHPKWQTIFKALLTIYSLESIYPIINSNVAKNSILINFITKKRETKTTKTCTDCFYLILLCTCLFI